MTAANDVHWTVADIRRALKAVKAGGESVAAVDFPKEGGFRVLLGEPVKVSVSIRSGANEWDEVLAS